MVLIYFLEKNNIPFYVGKTTESFRVKREYKHKERFGQDVNMFILDYVEEQGWKFWECYWISQFQTWGFVLENKNNGGGGLSKMEIHSKQMISLKNSKLKPSYFKGHNIPHSELTKQKMRKPKPPGFGDRIKNLKERNLKISIKALGNTRKKGTKESQEARLNKSKAALGKNKSEQHKQNMNVAVLQLNLSGLIVKRWSRVQDIINSNTISTGVLYRCLKNPEKAVKGSKWVYERERKEQEKLG